MGVLIMGALQDKPAPSGSNSLDVTLPKGSPVLLKVEV